MADAEPSALERIELGRTVGSLAFSPNGRLLAEGPTPGVDIQIRDLETRKLVQTLAGADGQLHGYSGRGGLATKARLLALEGVTTSG